MRRQWWLAGCGILGCIMALMVGPVMGLPVTLWDDDFEVSVGSRISYTITSTGDEVYQIEVTVTSGRVTVTVIAEEDYVDWVTGDTVPVYFTRTDVTTVSDTWSPTTANLYLITVNNSHPTDPAEGTLLITYERDTTTEEQEIQLMWMIVGGYGVLAVVVAVAFMVRSLRWSPRVTVTRSWRGSPRSSPGGMRKR